MLNDRTAKPIDYVNQQTDNNFGYVDYAVYTPSTYWKENADLVPMSAQARVTQYNRFRDLMHGNFASLVKGNQTHMNLNYFATAVETLAQFVMSFPPDIEGVTEEELRMAHQETYNFLIQALSKGTGVFTSFNNGMEQGILSIEPTIWFPYPDNLGDAIVTTQKIVESDGRFANKVNVEVLKMGLNDSEILYFESSGNKLNTLLERVQIDNVDERMTSTYARKPTNLDWGTSMLLGMIPYVRAIINRYSRSESILDAHENPLVVFFRDMIDNDNINYGTNVQSEDTIQLENLTIEQYKQQVGLFLDPRFRDAKYLTWDGQLSNSYEFITRLEDQLYTKSELPAALQGILRGGDIPSGQALKRMFANTYTVIDDLQHGIIPVLSDALRKAGIEHGEIEWRNPLDELDKIEVENTTETQEDEDVVSGANLVGE